MSHCLCSMVFSPNTTNFLSHELQKMVQELGVFCLLNSTSIGEIWGRDMTKRKTLGKDPAWDKDQCLLVFKKKVAAQFHRRGGLQKKGCLSEGLKWEEAWFRLASKKGRGRLVDSLIERQEEAIYLGPSSKRERKRGFFWWERKENLWFFLV